MLIPFLKELSTDFKFVLASKSPRRKQLLTEMGLKFEIAPQDTPELIRDKSFKRDIVQATLEKLEAYPAKKKQIIIACDTIVVCRGKVYGKPKTKVEAREFLQTLSNRRHDVYSCVVVKAVGKTTRVYQTLERTAVYFRRLEKIEIEKYIATSEPYDKAGGYAVQSGSMAFVKKINGCYYNVIGLPLNAMLELLKKLKGDRHNGLV